MTNPYVTRPADHGNHKTSRVWSFAPGMKIVQVFG